MKVKKEIIKKIIKHAKKDAPVEACGYLAQADGVVSHYYELTNIDKSGEHFSFDSKEQFETVLEARSNGLELCAVYHSHPKTPARPSEEDIKLAYDPHLSYVIVSLSDPSEADVKSYKIIGGEVDQETLEIVEHD